MVTQTQHHMNRIVDFDNPPLVEVVISVVFRPLKVRTNIELYRLTEPFQKEHPHIQEHPSIERNLEKFGTSKIVRPEPRIEFLQTQNLRYWFLDKSFSRIVQFQNDRFVSNWRRTGDVHNYPKYPATKDKFLQELSVFEKEVEKFGDKIEIEQIEMSYQNHIEPTSDISSAFKFLNLDSEIEDIAFRSRKKLQIGNTESPNARLHTELRPAIHAGTGKQVYLFSLSVNTLYSNGSDINVILDDSRHTIVTEFLNQTSEPMQQTWGIKA